jgi:iron complex outermembrane receptor protein
LKYFRLVGNATWQDTENRGKIKAFNGKKLPGRFEKSYLGRIEARYEGFKVYCEKIIEEEMYYDTANLLKAENKKEINAGVSWLFHSILFSFEARNLEDNQYEDFNGYPLPGRSYYFAIRYSL